MFSKCLKSPSLIFTVLLIVLIESIIFWGHRDSRADLPDLLDERFYPPNRVPAFEESIIQWQFYHALADQTPVDILLVGDSSCLMGLRPELIQKRTGLSCWNIGTLDYLGARGYTDALELFIQVRGAPKIVIYHIVNISLNFNEQAIKRFGYLERIHNWLSHYRSGEDDGRMMPTLPSMRYRRQVQRFVTTFSGEEKQEWLDEKRGPYPSDNEVRELIRTSRGALTEIQFEDLSQAQLIKPGIHPEAQSEFLRAVELCARHDITMIIVLNPIPLNAKIPENLHNLHLFEAKIKALTRDYDCVRLHSPLYRFYPIELCASYNHLTEVGAEYNSEQVARSIMNELDLDISVLPILPDFEQKYTPSGLIFPNSDFESGTMKGWRYIGSAFLDQPIRGDTIAQRTSNSTRANQQGEYWVGTSEPYQTNDNQNQGDCRGDTATGSLTSLPFIISQGRIAFLIGGGNKPDSLFVALQIGDRIVRKTSAGYLEAMRINTWDVSDLVGQEAQIVVNDMDSSHFGHINIDYFHYQVPVEPQN
ncbi:hypothetical protein JXQ70_10750 [bacterium]|nr:hypothetical protein [bacterium]